LAFRGTKNFHIEPIHFIEDDGKFVNVSFQQEVSMKINHGFLYIKTGLAKLFYRHKMKNAMGGIRIKRAVLAEDFRSSVFVHLSYS
jgi:hypothetical protein